MTCRQCTADRVYGGHWDIGTTEPGSSGSPLFNQDNRVIGQLHGGDAACDNDESDWYGAFYASWTGGDKSKSRLLDWLDPATPGNCSLTAAMPAHRDQSTDNHDPDGNSDGTAVKVSR